MPSAGAKDHVAGGLPPESDLTAIDPKDAWVATRRTARRADGVARQKSELHQPVRQVARELNAVQQAFLVFEEIRQCAEGV